MWKLAGALFIIGGCGYAGLTVGAAYRKRTETLRCLQHGLNLLETEINYGLTPLPLALQRVGQRLPGASAKVFSRAAQILGRAEGITAQEAWDEGIRALSETTPLWEEEISILTLFGRGLGSSDKEDQLKHFALTREQLRLAEQKAIDARNKNQRIWQYMGFCLGAVIVLILI